MESFPQQQKKKSQIVGETVVHNFIVIHQNIIVPLSYRFRVEVKIELLIVYLFTLCFLTLNLKEGKNCVSSKL